MKIVLIKDKNTCKIYESINIKELLMKSNMKDISKQLNKEAIMTIGLYIFFFVWWYVLSYGLGNKEVSQYNYILGLPEWFFYSCVLGYVVICIAVFVMVKVFFKDVDFEDTDEKSREKK